MVCSTQICFIHFEKIKKFPYRNYCGHLWFSRPSSTKKFLSHLVQSKVKLRVCLSHISRFQDPQPMRNKITITFAAWRRWFNTLGEALLLRKKRNFPSTVLMPSMRRYFFLYGYFARKFLFLQIRCWCSIILNSEKFISIIDFKFRFFVLVYHIPRNFFLVLQKKNSTKRHEIFCHVHYAVFIDMRYQTDFFFIGQQL